jgi:hypothetical protein
MDMGKTSFWDWDGKVGGRNMVVDFCFLARNAFFCPLIDISGHVGPNKMGRNEAAGGLDAWVA